MARAHDGERAVADTMGGEQQPVSAPRSAPSAGTLLVELLNNESTSISAATSKGIHPLIMERFEYYFTT
jgi:hypothetical protein